MAVSRRLRDMSFSIVRGAHARTCDTLHTNDPIVSFRTVHSPRGRRLRRVHSARKHAHATQIRRNKLEAGGPPAESNLSPADDQLRRTGHAKRTQFEVVSARKPTNGILGLTKRYFSSSRRR